MRYFYVKAIICFLFLGLSAVSYSQTHTQDTKTNRQDIAGLSLQPNPVSHGKLYITTHKNLTKSIVIFDVLGNRILNTTIFGKELNVSKLRPGIYIIKITENKVTATRKLIVK